MQFTVSGMTCGGCVKAVTRAIQSSDPNAEVNVDLASQLIDLKTNLTQEQAKELIEDAGYPVKS